jgi:hypothetical protein
MYCQAASADSAGVMLCVHRKPMLPTAPDTHEKLGLLWIHDMHLHRNARWVFWARGVSVYQL